MCEERNTVCPLLGLAHALAKHNLHQRVKPTRRLVEQEQISPGRERGDQRHLLAVALRQRPDLLARVDLEALDELTAVGEIDPALPLGACARRSGTQAAEELERLHRRQRRPQKRLSRHVRKAPVRADAIPPGIDPRTAPPARPGRGNPNNSRIVVVLPAPFGPR
jgi:hypothetical protein